MKIWTLMYIKVMKVLYISQMITFEFFFKNFRGDFIQNYDENIEIQVLKEKRAEYWRKM